MLNKCTLYEGEHSNYLYVPKSITGMKIRKFLNLGNKLGYTKWLSCKNCDYLFRNTKLSTHIQDALYADCSMYRTFSSV